MDYLRYPHRHCRERFREGQVAGQSGRRLGRVTSRVEAEGALDEELAQEESLVQVNADCQVETPIVCVRF